MNNRANQRSADVRGGHAADAGAHRRRAYSDAAHLGRKQLARVDVDARERDADEQLAEHRQSHRRRVVVCTQRTRSFATNVKVKFPHARYRALSPDAPEPIPVYGHSQPAGDVK